MTKRNEIDEALESDLRSLPPEQFNQVAEIVSKVRSEQADTRGNFQRSVSNMTDRELDDLWRKNGWK